MSSSIEKLLLRPREVAEATGLGRSTTYALFKSGVIPSIAIGETRIRRVPSEALRKWITEQLNANGSDQSCELNEFS